MIAGFLPLKLVDSAKALDPTDPRLWDPSQSKKIAEEEYGKRLVKFSCSSCINGHRTLTCVHIDRALVMVKDRGQYNKDKANKFITPIIDPSAQLQFYIKEMPRCPQTGRGIYSCTSPTKCCPSGDKWTILLDMDFIPLRLVHNGIQILLPKDFGLDVAPFVGASQDREAYRRSCLIHDNVAYDEEEIQQYIARDTAVVGSTKFKDLIKRNYGFDANKEIARNPSAEAKFLGSVLNRQLSLQAAHTNRDSIGELKKMSSRAGSTYSRADKSTTQAPKSTPTPRLHITDSTSNGKAEEPKRRKYLQSPTCTIEATQPFAKDYKQREDPNEIYKDTGNGELNLFINESLQMCINPAALLNSGIGSEFLKVQPPSVNSQTQAESVLQSSSTGFSNNWTFGVNVPEPSTEPSSYFNHLQVLCEEMAQNQLTQQPERYASGYRDITNVTEVQQRHEGSDVSTEYWNGKFDNYLSNGGGITGTLGESSSSATAAAVTAVFHKHQSSLHPSSQYAETHQQMPASFDTNYTETVQSSFQSASSSEDEHPRTPISFISQITSKIDSQQANQPVPAASDNSEFLNFEDEVAEEDENRMTLEKLLAFDPDADSFPSCSDEDFNAFCNELQECLDSNHL